MSNRLETTRMAFLSGSFGLIHVNTRFAIVIHKRMLATLQSSGHERTVNYFALF